MKSDASAKPQGVLLMVRGATNFLGLPITAGRYLFVVSVQNILAGFSLLPMTRSLV